MSRSGIFIFCCLLSLSATARNEKLHSEDPEFYLTEEAARIGRQVMTFQRVTGGWPKNTDMQSPMTRARLDSVAGCKMNMFDSTTDNGATNLQLHFLARLFQATGDTAVRDSFRKGVEYLLSGQYENGGWPQFWPVNDGYQVHITFNDGAMCNTLNILRKVSEGKEEFGGGLADETLRHRCGEAFGRGVECILSTQIHVDGKPAIWCQQHDRDTFAPAKARAYELPSFCSQESVEILRLLMSLPEPDERVKRSIHGAMDWLDRHKISGFRVYRTGRNRRDPDFDTKVVRDAGGGPIWARFYDLETGAPFFCDRDGIPRDRLEEVGPERRNGYRWFNDNFADIYDNYERWADRNDPAGKVGVSLESPGGNETGLFPFYED